MLRPITLVKYASVLFIYVFYSFTSNITDEYGIQQCLKINAIPVSYSCIKTQSKCVADSYKSTHRLLTFDV